MGKTIITSFKRRICLLALACLPFSAIAERLEFTSPSYSTGSSQYWPTVNGFNMGPYWASNGGRDLRNAPYIDGYSAGLYHVGGTFTFNSVELSAWPWDNAWFGPDVKHLTISFAGPGLTFIASRSFDVFYGQSYGKFTERIEGVQYILFQASTSGVRLGAITINEPDVPAVPEPNPVLMMGAGLALVGLLARRSRSS